MKSMGSYLNNLRKISKESAIAHFTGVIIVFVISSQILPHINIKVNIWIATLTIAILFVFYIYLLIDIKQKREYELNPKLRLINEINILLGDTYKTIEDSSYYQLLIIKWRLTSENRKFIEVHNNKWIINAHASYLYILIVFRNFLRSLEAGNTIISLTNIDCQKHDKSQHDRLLDMQNYEHNAELLQPHHVEKIDAARKKINNKTICLFPFELIDPNTRDLQQWKELVDIVTRNYNALLIYRDDTLVNKYHSLCFYPVVNYLEVSKKTFALYSNDSNSEKMILETNLSLHPNITVSIIPNEHSEDYVSYMNKKMEFDNYFLGTDKRTIYQMYKFINGGPY